MKQFKKFTVGLMLILTLSMLTACSTKKEEVKETETNRMTETSTIRETILETTDHTNKGVVGEIGEDIMDGAETVVDDIRDGIETNTRETMTETVR